MTIEDPKWKQIERVVLLLEQTISPSSTIKHNVQMPDLTEASKTRQCDVVIWSGDLPRQTITIVEVQDREAKFDINTFDGLCKKMQKVGAQHLVCVSSQKFPKSIIREAIKQGPTVRLIRLQELEEVNWPINIFENSIQIVTRTILKISDVKLGVKKGQLPPNPKDKSSSQEKNIRVSGHTKHLSFNDLMDIFIDQYQIDNGQLEKGIHSFSVHFPQKGQSIWWVGSETEIVLKAVDFNTDILIKKRKIPLKVSSYHQTDFDNTLAWIMEAKGVEGDKEFDFKVTLIPTDSGNYLTRLWEFPEDFKGRIDIFEKEKN